ncbi:BsaA family SipW-dependent biofilm matrix protein [Candidatus Saccharibacteria bacterium]|nr:BsaA family SipW-dependent biofilm matrix protein [Candidatus Saccharibacteria bacterium]
MKKFFNKKHLPLIATVALIAIAGIGAVIAYSRSVSVIDSDILLGQYRTTITNEFTSPPNWQPGQTVPDEIEVTNDFDRDIAVRAKIEEEWTDKDGDPLPLVSPNSGLKMAEIEFPDDSDWKKEGDYYVYDDDLEPGETTTPLITGVTLNPEANLDTSDNAEDDADGEYADAEYRLEITIETIIAEEKRVWYLLYDVVANQVNDLGDYQIDFRDRATMYSYGSIATANGNGVNRLTEKGADVYYYRGQMEDNFVYWGNFCWQMFRTTATGGVKMIYAGLPTDVDGKMQCNTDKFDSAMVIPLPGEFNGAYYSVDGNSNKYSPADVGYMYGERIMPERFTPASDQVLTFSNNVSRNGSTYTLDTTAGQYLTGLWSDNIDEAQTRYHYFCLDGATTCDNTKIGYMLSYVNYTNTNTLYISYLPVNGYDNIEAMKNAMFANEHDSLVKAALETWFEDSNLDGHVGGARNYEDDLEDAVFCNERTLYSGPLKSKDDGGLTSYFNAAYRVSSTVNNSSNITPSLDCASARDSFTKYSSNGNGKLKHKVGLITADELRLAGLVDGSVFIHSNPGTWTMTPADFSTESASVYSMSSYIYNKSIVNSNPVRPVVSLKAGTEYIPGGNGTRGNPYYIQYYD